MTDLPGEARSDLRRVQVGAALAGRLPLAETRAAGAALANGPPTMGGQAAEAEVGARSPADGRAVECVMHPTMLPAGVPAAVVQARATVRIGFLNPRGFGRSLQTAAPGGLPHLMWEVPLDVLMCAETKHTEHTTLDRLMHETGLEWVGRPHPGFPGVPPLSEGGVGFLINAANGWVVLAQVESRDPGIFTVHLAREGLAGTMALTVAYRQPPYNRRGGRASASRTTEANEAFYGHLDEALALYPEAEVHLVMMDANAHIAESITGPLEWPRAVAPGCMATDADGHRMLRLEWPSPGEDREQYVLIPGRNGRAMPGAQYVLGVGSLTYFSETGNGAATEIDLSFLRVRDWPRLVSYDVDSDWKYHVGGADHRLLVAGIALDVTAEGDSPEELVGCEDGTASDAAALEYDLDPLEKDGWNRKRFHGAAQAASDRAVERLQRRVGRATSVADVTAAVAAAEVETREVVQKALAASGLRAKAPRGGPDNGRTPTLNRGLQSQPWWDLVPSLPWMVAQERIAREARARAQAEHRGGVEAVLSGAGAEPPTPPLGRPPMSCSEAAQGVCPVLWTRLADATVRWQAARGQLLNTCSAARLQYHAMKARELMEIRSQSTRAFFRAVKRTSHASKGSGIPLLRDPEKGGGLAASLKRNAHIWRDHFAKLGVESLTTNANKAVIWEAQAAEQLRQTEDAALREAELSAAGGLAESVRTDIRAVASGAHAHACALQHAERLAEQGEAPPDEVPADARLSKVPELIAPKDLNGPFEMAEAQRALGSLRAGSAHGGDAVPPECKYLKGAFVTLIWFMLQLWWAAELFPVRYDTTPLWPVFKDGDPTDPGNYRGISLLSVFYKLFESVMGYRLYCYFERLPPGMRVDPNQAGYRWGIGTTHQLYLLTEAMRDARRRKVMLILAFVDLKKAFPNVQTSLLWGQLRLLGVTGKFLRMLQLMYGNVSSYVMSGGERKEELIYRIYSGLREGSKLSPLLFLVFINPMIIGLRAAAPGVLLAGVWIGALLYADDLVIISESPEEMQRMLDCFAEWCAENNQDPNIKKTHMVFMDVDPAARARRQEAEPRLAFTLPPRREGESRLTIQEKDGYKYLGIWVSWDGIWTKHANARMAAAFTAVRAAAPMGCVIGVLPMPLILNLWQVMFEPVLTTGISVWGHDQKVQRSITGATRAFLMRACRLDWAPPAGLLELELGVPSAAGAWAKALMMELHRLHTGRMGNALEPVHQANLRGEPWDERGAWDGRNAGTPRLAGPSALKTFEHRAIAAVSAMPGMAEYVVRTDDLSGGPVKLALAGLSKGDWALVVSSAVRQWDLDRIIEKAGTEGRTAAWHAHCMMDVLPEGMHDLHRLPRMVSPVRLPHHYTAGVHASGIAERLAWRVGGSCLLAHTGRPRGLKYAQRYCRLCAAGARRQAIEDPLHLATECDCPDLAHAALTAAVAEARTLSRSERGPLEGTGWVHHCQEAAQDWERLRESDPGQALGILLGTRDATERWLGDAEPASRHLSRSGEPSLPLSSVVEQSRARQELSAACGAFIRKADSLVRGREIISAEEEPWGMAAPVADSDMSDSPGEEESPCRPGRAGYFGSGSDDSDRTTVSGDASSDEGMSLADTGEPSLTSDGSEGEGRPREWFRMDCVEYEVAHLGGDPAAGGGWTG